ncbi:hypothetical protein Taro_055138, partial [Colocasia esculenta]|nr:hypothetical protein [Colocasia esculenta]
TEIPPRSVCYSIPTAVPFDRTQISVRPGVGTAREAPIRNRHFDSVAKSTDYLDYANRWRTHTRSRPVTAIGSRVQLVARSPPQTAASMAADYWLAAIPLDVDPSWRPPPWTSAWCWRQHRLTSTGNTVNVTVELSSFGRPKEEKLKPHLRPLREAATTTWSKHSLGHSQPSQPRSQRSQIATHHRQRETSDVREPPEDIHSRHGDTAAERIVHSLFSGDHSGTSSAATVSVFIQSSVTAGSFLSFVLASPHILGQPFFGLQPFTRGFPLG